MTGATKRRVWRLTIVLFCFNNPLLEIFIVITSQEGLHHWPPHLECTRSPALGRVYVGGNIDSIAICILRRAICILQKVLGNIVLDSKSFWFRRKHPYCNPVLIFWWKFGQTRSNTLDFYTNYPTPLLCTTLTIGAAEHNSNYQGSHTQS